MRVECYFLALASRFPFLVRSAYSFFSAYFLFLRLYLPPRRPLPRRRSPPTISLSLLVLFFSCPRSSGPCRLCASSNRYGIKPRNRAVESRWYDRVLVTISSSDIPARISPESTSGLGFRASPPFHVSDLLVFLCLYISLSLSLFLWFLPRLIFLSLSLSIFRKIFHFLEPPVSPNFEFPTRRCISCITRVQVHGILIIKGSCPLLLLSTHMSVKRKI